MRDQELKKLLAETEESPSYDFSSKTMRKIESLKESKASLSYKGNNSAIRYIIPLLLVCLFVVSAFLNDPQLVSFDVQLPKGELSWPSFDLQHVNIHFNWLIASIAIATGFWTWIWWEKRNLRFQ